MLLSLKSFLAKRYISFRSWNTNRKILILESDDWGSERSWDASIVKSLIRLNPEIVKDRMTMLDSIASQDDLTLLLDLLHSVKDINNRCAVLTINVCTANPDFEKIRNSDFSEFYYIPFFESIKKRSDGGEILSIWQNAIREGLFFPQLHGREHLHALAWLNELRLGNRELLEGFKLGVWGIPYKALGIQRRNNLQAALDTYGFENEFEFQLNWIKEGSQIFNDYFGFKSSTFIPPAYTWPRKFIKYYHQFGLDGIQGINLQYEPLLGKNKKYKLVPHINGVKENEHVYRLSRNAYFEPFSNPANDWTNSSLKSIDRAFSNNQPAILGCHRVNFIGVINKANRDNNLKDFSILLKSIKKRWPDVEFMNSAELLEQFKF